MLNMDSSEAKRLMFLGLMSKLPEEDRKKVEQCAEKMRALMAEYGHHGIMAMGILGVEAEEAMENDG